MGQGGKRHSYFVHVLYFILYLLEKSLSRMRLKYLCLINDLGNNLRAASAVQNASLTP